MVSGSNDRKDCYVGLKVPHWKREALKEVARDSRTDVSALLRMHIDDLLEENGFDGPSSLPGEIEIEADD